MVEVCTSAGFYFLDEGMDTSAVGGEPVHKTLMADRPARARTFGEILESKAQVVETKAKPAACEEVENLRHLAGERCPVWHRGNPAPSTGGSPRVFRSSPSGGKS